MRKQQQGFTLIEIAIVLVIIGLLLGGVLKGQELIQNARVRNVIAQQDGIKAAFFGFQDRYRGIPGDYSPTLANQNIPGAGTTCGGNGDSLIKNTTFTGSASSENICAWYHLSKANFITGSYSGSGTTENANNSPVNPFGGPMQIIYDSTYSDPSGSPSSVHNIKTGINIPASILAEVDRKLDDGYPSSGAFRFSTYGSVTAASCIVAGTAPAPDTWSIASGATVCGGASLF